MQQFLSTAVRPTSQSPMRLPSLPEATLPTATVAESHYAPVSAIETQRPPVSQYAPAVAVVRSFTPSLVPEPVASVTMTPGRSTPLYAPSAVGRSTPLYAPAVQRTVTPSLSTDVTAVVNLNAGRVTPLYAPAPAVAEMRAPPAAFRPVSPAVVSFEFNPPSIPAPYQPVAIVPEDNVLMTLRAPDEQPMLVAPVSSEENAAQTSAQATVKKTVRKVKKTAATGVSTPRKATVTLDVAEVV